MHVTCFFFFFSCKSSCATCIYNTTVVFIKNTDCKKKKKNFLGLQYQKLKIHNYYNPSFLGLLFFWSTKLILCSVGRGIL